MNTKTQKSFEKILHLTTLSAEPSDIFDLIQKIAPHIPIDYKKDISAGSEIDSASDGCLSELWIKQYLYNSAFSKLIKLSFEDGIPFSKEQFVGSVFYLFHNKPEGDITNFFLDIHKNHWEQDQDIKDALLSCVLTHRDISKNDPILLKILSAGADPSYGLQFVHDLKTFELLLEYNADASKPCRQDLLSTKYSYSSGFFRSKKQPFVFREDETVYDLLEREKPGKFLNQNIKKIILDQLSLKIFSNDQSSNSTDLNNQIVKTAKNGVHYEFGDLYRLIKLLKGDPLSHIFNIDDKKYNLHHVIAKYGHLYNFLSSKKTKEIEISNTLDEDGFNVLELALMESEKKYPLMWNGEKSTFQSISQKIPMSAQDFAKITLLTHSELLIKEPESGALPFCHVKQKNNIDGSLQCCDPNDFLDHMNNPEGMEFALESTKKLTITDLSNTNSNHRQNQAKANNAWFQLTSQNLNHRIFQNEEWTEFSIFLAVYDTSKVFHSISNTTLEIKLNPYLKFKNSIQTLHKIAKAMANSNHSLFDNIQIDVLEKFILNSEKNILANSLTTKTQTEQRHSL